MYKITITKTKPNEKFAEQFAEYKEASRYNRNIGADLSYPSDVIEVKQLETTPTDEEFVAIKRAVLECA